jgi:hypothetical protein
MSEWSEADWESDSSTWTEDERASYLEWLRDDLAGVLDTAGMARLAALVRRCPLDELRGRRRDILALSKAPGGPAALFLLDSALPSPDGA